MMGDNKLKYVSFAALAMFSAAATAQTTAGDSAAPVTATPAASAVAAVAKEEVTGNSAVLPANTQVDVTLNSEVSSKKMKQGDKFVVSVSRDVMLGNFIVIPRGTRGEGHISYRTGKGAFGKSAKMEIEITSLDLNGRSIPVSGKFRQEGQGNTGATVGTAVAVGVFSAFVTGRSAIFEQGRELRVFTSEGLPVTLPAKADPVVAAATAQPAVNAQAALSK
ncbi:MAG: hypothetical protein LKG22_00860 [Sphingobium sp.]|jgi:hypothetical protein|nr:hypothetical protein [Sphingobium sp.]MCI2051635.1 hypothetical protein [Sphingobium sp.]